MPSKDALPLFSLQICQICQFSSKCAVCVLREDVLVHIFKDEAAFLGIPIDPLIQEKKGREGSTYQEVSNSNFAGSTPPVPEHTLTLLLLPVHIGGFQFSCVLWFELNVFGVINMTRLALEHFNKSGSGGQVAVVSSLAGVIGVPYSGTYTGTKYAIHGYFNSLRNEKMGKNISVSLICPGPTFTNFLQESFTEKDGVKYEQTVKPTDRRMTAQRCGDLSAIALTNKLGECWMGLFPLMPFTYISVYFPVIFNTALKIVGPEIMFKLRDSKKVELKEGKFK